MSVESASFINQLNESNPTSSDLKSEGDNHIRLLKSTLKTTFPNVTGAVTATHTELNSIGSKLPTSGGTMTGQITLPGGGTGNQAATVSQLVAEIAAASSVNLPSQTGNAGKFLTTDGTTPSWGTTGGSWVLLGTVTASNSATVVLEQFSSTYDNYVVVISDMSPSANGNYVSCNLKYGGSYNTSTNHRHIHQWLDTSSFSAWSFSSNPSGTTLFRLSPNATPNTTDVFSAVIWMFGVNQSSSIKSMSYESSFCQSGSMQHAKGQMNFISAVAAVQGIRFQMSSGNIASGSFSIYGIKKT